MNLLEETLSDLSENGKSAAAVVWVGAKCGWFTWEEFESVAKDTEYDEGYGGTEVAKDLVVVGSDFWLERHEYDGSEWWEFKALPKQPLVHVVPKTLLADYGDCLEVL